MRFTSKLMVMGITAIIVGIIAIGGSAIYVIVQQDALGELDDFVVAVVVDLFPLQLPRGLRVPRFREHHRLGFPGRQRDFVV